MFEMLHLQPHGHLQPVGYVDANQFINPYQSIYTWSHGKSNFGKSIVQVKYGVKYRVLQLGGP